MSQPVQSSPSAPSRAVASTIEVSLIAFAAVDLGLALFMAIAPHAFYKAIGPFGTANSHYVRDVASFQAAIGVGLLLAVRRHSWRAPALAISTVQYGLHTINHLVDIGNAHPAWTGYADFVSLLGGTIILAWLWRVAAGAEAAVPAPPGQRPQPIPERSFT